MAAKKQRRKEGYPLIEILKSAIETSGQTLYQIAKETSISAGQLSRFMRGERQLSLIVAAKLFDFLGLEVSKAKPAKK